MVSPDLVHVWVALVFAEGGWPAASQRGFQASRVPSLIRAVVISSMAAMT